ncbi:UvrABC system protein B [subsurface metagenome]
MKLQLRDYQTECLNAISEASKAKISKPLVSLPTGTGKTIIFAYIIREISRRGGRSLVLVHRDELLNQAEDKLLTIWPEAEVGIVKAARNELDAPVTIASVQTASRQSRLKQLCDSGFDFIVTDEAHHAVAASYQRIYDRLLNGNGSGQLHLGVTATPNRGDRRGLLEVYEKVVYHRSLLEMIRAGWLCDLRCVQITTDISLDSVKTRQGDFAQGELGAVVNTENRNELIVQAYHEHAAGRMALCFTVDVQHAHDLADAFQEEGVNAVALSGKTPIDERRRTLRQFHNREMDVICNCQVLTEGYDEPAVDSIILARPTKSSALYTQMVGRGTRTFPGKSDCLILDFADVAGRHRIMQLPNLVGLKEQQELDGRQTLTELVDRDRESEGLYGQGKGIEASEIDIFDRSRFRWLQIKDSFLLNLGNEGKIQVIPSKVFGRYVVVHIDGSESDYLNHRPINLSWAMGIAESHAEDITDGRLGIALKAARWRFDRATEKQLKILDMYDVDYDSGITKGDASDVIDVIFASKKAAAY